jgi:light-regulated signal transduction histidine kinase (bacteriophytochrome)
MGVGASVTISLVVNRKLWGLVACHNLRPKSISLEQREKCEMLGRMISTHINESQRTEELLHKSRMNGIHRQLQERMKETQDLSEELTQKSPNVLDLIDSKGVSAALSISGHWVSAGRVPSEAQMNKIVDWLKLNVSQDHFFTHNLLAHMPEAREFKDIASGLLAASIPKTDHNYILWFRPEVMQSVSWAGNPHEKVVDQNGRLSPRASFEEWKETVGGFSYPWKSWEVDAALDLRNSIMAHDLKVQYKKEQLARADAERAVKTREDLVAMVSHDLKNPLSSIQMNAQLLARFIPDPSEKVKNTMERLIRSAQVMNSLIDDILNVTKIDSGNLDLEFNLRSIADVINESIDILNPLAQQKGITLEVKLGSLECHLFYDFGRILQVVSNILGNAIKFTPEGGRITVAVEKCGPDFVKLAITDSGVGIPQDHLKHVFDRFWQAHQSKRLGTGLGLAIVKGIVDQHGGEIWVESELEKGSTFHFTLPLRTSL